jgi:hypothetical protein
MEEARLPHRRGERERYSLVTFTTSYSLVTFTTSYSLVFKTTSR